MSEEKHNAVLSIAGYDPSGGAGVIADCKTFEAIGNHGCAVMTSITFQNDTDFHGIKWLTFQDIEKQFMSLAERFEFRIAKIGLIENIEMLGSCINMLKANNPDVKIIWDPILKASAGFEFHKNIDSRKLFSILKELYLITPNLEESKILFPDGLERAISCCNVLVKDCEINGPNAVDTLFSDGKITHFSEKRLDGYEKHGTGCVLSAAIASFLFVGSKGLEDSCRMAKKYTKKFMYTSDSRLGFHDYVAEDDTLDFKYE